MMMWCIFSWDSYDNCLLCVWFRIQVSVWTQLHFFQKLLANVFPAQCYGSEASWCERKISAYCLCVEYYKSWEHALFMCWISFQSWEKQHVLGDGFEVWTLANKCVTLQCNEWVMDMFFFIFNVLLVQLTDTITLESKGQPRLTCGRWNPHHNCAQVVTANETTIRGWDLRSKQWGNISLPSGLTLVYKQRMNSCCGLVTCMQVTAGYCSTFLVPIFSLSWSS